MKSEEIFIIIASWFIGMLGSGMEVCFNHVFDNNGRTFYGVFSLVFFGFSIYFVLKYSGLLDLFKKKKPKN